MNVIQLTNFLIGQTEQPEIIMKTLVTGATGGLGQNLVQTLLKNGHTVTATGRNETIGKQLAAQGVFFKAANLEDSPTIHTLCKGQDIVFHCAALASPWGTYDEFYKANVIGTKNIADGCLKHDVSRLVHVSTPSIYFNYTNKLNIKETDPLPAQQATYYAATKLAAEQVLDKLFQEQGLPFIAIRPRAIFGPHDKTIFPRLLRTAKNGRVPLIAGGKALVDASYVENVVDSLLLCSTAPAACIGKKYNISNGEPETFRELTRQIFTALDLPFNPRTIPFPVAYAIAILSEGVASLPFLSFEPVLTRYGVSIFAFSQTLDISAAQRELGYVPAVSLKEGIQRFARWWQEHNHN
jgi:nucleoside-diphosphate-sugar epimerase